MKPRERVMTALNHQEPDRYPMPISFTPEFAARLKADLQLKGHGLHNPHGGGSTYELERCLDEEPRMADLMASLRAINPQIKITYHTAGVVYPIIPDLIEIGIEVMIGGAPITEEYVNDSGVDLTRQRLCCSS